MRRKHLWALLCYRNKELWQVLCGRSGLRRKNQRGAKSKPFAFIAFPKASYTSRCSISCPRGDGCLHTLSCPQSSAIRLLCGRSGVHSPLASFQECTATDIFFFPLLFKQSNRTSKDVRSLKKIHLISKRYLWWSNYFPFLPFRGWKNLYNRNDRLTPGFVSRVDWEAELTLLYRYPEKFNFHSAIKPTKYVLKYLMWSKSLLYFR